MRNENKQVVMATDSMGAAVAVGPVYSGEGLDDLRKQIEARPGWTIEGTAVLISKAQLEWEVR